MIVVTDDPAASRLEARSGHLRVMALCPFIANWLRHHAEHLDLEYRTA